MSQVYETILVLSRNENNHRVQLYRCLVGKPYTDSLGRTYKHRAFTYETTFYATVENGATKYWGKSEVDAKDAYYKAVKKSNLDDIPDSVKSRRYAEHNRAPKLGV